MPDDEVHEFFNDMMRGVGTQFLGRRTYETTAVWETDPGFAQESVDLSVSGPELATHAFARRSRQRDQRWARPR